MDMTIFDLAVDSNDKEWFDRLHKIKNEYENPKEFKKLESVLNIALEEKDEEMFNNLCNIQNKDRGELLIESIENAKSMDETDSILEQINFNDSEIEGFEDVLNTLIKKNLSLQGITLEEAQFMDDIEFKSY